MMRTAMLAAAALLVVACGGKRGASDTTAAANSNDPVQLAVAVKRGIDASPGKADSVVSAHGLTPEGYDSLMYKIASDSALRAQYAAAR